MIALAMGALLGYVAFRLSTGQNQESSPEQPALQEPDRAEQAERERMHVIYNLISTLTSTLNYQRILNTAIDLSASVVGNAHEPSDRLVSAVLLFSQSEGNQPELSVGSARRFTPADTRLTLPGVSGVIGQAIEQGETLLTREVAEDSELGHFVTLRNCQSALCIPLRAGLETYGVLLFAHPDADYFNPDRQDILSILGSQAAIAIQNARLYDNLALEKERMMEFQEEARKKLARDLHDGPAQSIAAIAMGVNYARRLMDRDLKTSAEELFKIEEMARKATKEIRHMLFTLRPLVLESQGLSSALEAMSEKMRETYNQNVIISVDPGVISQLEMGKQAVIFYIAEEAVGNSRKHAQAAHTWVKLRPLNGDLALLEIEDDGVGFNVGAVDAMYEQRGSLGMVNMRERAELVNGMLHIESAEGRGTRIQVVIPISEEAADRLRQRL